MPFIKEPSVHVNASPQAVYDFVSNVSGHAEWAFNPMEISHAGGPTHGVGAEYTSKVRKALGPAGSAKATIRVITAEPPSTFEYEVKDTGGRYRWGFHIAPDGTGAKLTQRMERLSAPIVVKVIQPFIWKVIGRKQIEGGLAKIKDMIERKS